MKTETSHAGDFIISELDGHGSRDNVTLDDSVAVHSIAPRLIVAKTTFVISNLLGGLTPA